MVCAVLLLGALAPGTASARSHRAALDPAPQTAPTSAAPSPDPAPQATVRSQQSHATRPPTTAASKPVVVVPRVTLPAQHTVATSDGSGGRAVTPRRTGPAPRRARPATRHRAPTPNSPSARTNPVSLSFLTTDLLRLTSGLRAGTASGPDDGVLLLLSSLAMAALAVSSFTLLRRLKRFGGPPR